MTKIRKVKRAKKYRYNVNRKRMNRKRLPVPESERVQNAWNPRTSSRKNFKNLGLVFDLNEDIKHMNKECDTKNISTEETTKSTSIVKDLERDAEVTSNGKNFRFPKDQVESLTYFLDKYGDDYKGMSRDKRNYLQQTWKQIRYKIRLFKSIPAHYNEYLKNKKI